MSIGAIRPECTYYSEREVLNITDDGGRAMSFGQYMFSDRLVPEGRRFLATGASPWWVGVLSAQAPAGATDRFRRNRHFCRPAGAYGTDATTSHGLTPVAKNLCPCWGCAANYAFDLMYAKHVRGHGERDDPRREVQAENEYYSK